MTEKDSAQEMVDSALSMLPTNAMAGVDALKQKMIESESQRVVESQKEPVIETAKESVKASKNPIDEIIEKGLGVAETEKPKDEEKGEDIPDDLMFMKRKAKESEAIDIPDLKNAFDYIKKVTGVNIEKSEDFQSFVESHKGLVSEKEQLVAKTKELEYYKNVLDSMPDEMFEATRKWLADEDYRGFLKETLNDKIDFSKPFHEQSKEDVIEFYFPGQFSQDELSEEGNKAVDFAYKQVEPKYKQDQSKFKNKDMTFRKEHEKQLKEFNEKLTKSIQKAEEHLSTIPGINESHTKELKSIASKGQDGVFNMFFNEDGTWKDDALEKFSYVKYAKQNFEKIEKILEGKIRTKVNSELISRGADAPRKSNSDNTDAGIMAEQIKKHIETIVPKPNETF